MQKIGHDGIDDKVLIGTYFIARKGGNTINQEGRTPFDVSLQEAVQSTVDLEAIATIPVPTTAVCCEFLGLRFVVRVLESHKTKDCNRRRVREMRMYNTTPGGVKH